MTVSSLAVNWTVFIISLIGIGYFIGIAFINKIISKITQADLKQLFRKDDELYDEFNNDEKDPINPDVNRNQLMSFGENNIAMKYDNIFTQIESCMMKIFIDTLWKSVVYTLVIWLIFTSWFVYHDTYLQSFLATFFGIFASATVGFIAIKFSINAITRSLLDTNEGQFLSFSGNWLSASAIAVGTVSCCIFFEMSYQPLCKYLYMGDGEEGPNKHLDFSKAYDHLELNQKIQHLQFAYIGYALAIITASSFMRDIPMALGTGLIIGHDMAGSLKSDIYEDDEIEITLRKTSVIGKLLSFNLVFALDTLIGLATVTIVTGLLTSFTGLATYHSQGAYSFSLIVISIQLLLSMCVVVLAIIHKKPDPEDYDPETFHFPTFTASQIRLMLMISTGLSFIAYIALPYIYMPMISFDILRYEPTHPFNFHDVNHASLILCLELGLITQIMIIVISEYWTSHAFPPTMETAKETMEDTSHGIITLTRSASIAHLLLMSVLAFFLLFAYTQAGFYGVALFALAMISSPVFFLTLSFFQFISNEALDLSWYGKEIGYKITKRLHNMTWASGNYLIFLPLINTSAIFVINLVSIGLFCVIGEVKDIIVWDAFVVYGFLIGSAIAYLLKSQSIYQIKSIGHSILKDKKEAKKSENDKTHKNVFANHDPWDLLGEKITDNTIKMMINIMICTVTILFVAWLFGEKGMVGYMCGLNLVAIHLMYLNIVKFHTASNIRDYNTGKNKLLIAQLQALLDEGEERLNVEGYQHTIRLSISCTVTDSDSLAVYLLYNILFILQGARILCLGGFLGQYFEKHSTEISDNTVDATIGATMRAQESLQGQITNMENDVSKMAGSNHTFQEHDVEQLQQELNDLKLRENLLMQDIREDKQALDDIQNSQDQFKVAISLINRNIEENNKEQQEIKEDMIEIMRHISAINNGQDEAYHAAMDGEALMMMFWSL